MGSRSIYKTQQSSLSILKSPLKFSFLARVFGLADQKSFEALKRENLELNTINKRNIDAIKALSDQLAQSLSFQQNIIQNISTNLKVVENIPQTQNHLQQSVQDSFERATFYVQNTCQDLLNAKSNLLSLQNEALDSLGALELAEYMRSFLVNNLLTKQTQHILQSINKDPYPEDLEPSMIKLKKNFHIVQAQMGQINFKLEKYNIRIEESLWKPYPPASLAHDKIEICNPQIFSEIVKTAQQQGFNDINEKTKSIIIGETVPTISCFSKEKGYWLVKRRGKFVVLKSK